MGVTPAPEQASPLRLGVLGGTFDPIHVAHVALARAAIDALRLDRVLLVPSGQPWQKPELRTPAAHRLAMARLAAQADPRLEVDAIEVEHDGPSYTVDTLATLRGRVGPRAQLVLILGSDQLRNLHTWHRWQSLFDFAHVAATQRERVPLSDLPAPVEAVLRERGRDALPDAPAGGIVFFRMPAVPVSATAIRTQFQAGGRPDGLVAPAVLDYIDRHGLYRR